MGRGLPKPPQYVSDLHVPGGDWPLGRLVSLGLSGDVVWAVYQLCLVKGREDKGRDPVEEKIGLFLSTCFVLGTELSTCPHVS